MKTVIDSIAGGFLPAMQNIQDTAESDDQKEKRAQAWLESRLKELAADIFENLLKAPAIAHDTSRVGAEVDLGWEKRGPTVRECVTKMAHEYGVEIDIKADNTNVAPIATG